MSKQLFTVGHSNLSIQDFIQLINRYNISAIADVRSHPYSSYLPHFNRDLLKFELLKSKIKYVFLGDELGARPKDLSCYLDGRAIYTKIADSEEFKLGIQRLLTGINTYNIALMCSEKDPLFCHRTILICQYLRESDITIEHIIDESNLESHSQLEARLLDLHGFDLDNNCLKVPEVLQLNLFNFSQTSSQTKSISREEFLIQAYIKQEQKIAYKNK
ncbi:MAG: DUF488 family protein [Waterburya sp.]